MIAYYDWIMLPASTPLLFSKQSWHNYCACPYSGVVQPKQNTIMHSKGQESGHVKIPAEAICLASEPGSLWPFTR